MVHVVARVQQRGLGVELLVVAVVPLVLDREGHHLEAHDAAALEQRRVLVELDHDAHVVVQAVLVGLLVAGGRDEADGEPARDVVVVLIVHGHWQRVQDPKDTRKQRAGGMRGVKEGAGTWWGGGQIRSRRQGQPMFLKTSGTYQCTLYSSLMSWRNSFISLALYCFWQSFTHALGTFISNCTRANRDRHTSHGHVRQSMAMHDRSHSLISPMSKACC